MHTQTILLSIGAFIIALGVALFQYGYASKLNTRKKIIFIVLRFLSVFALLLLLINPEYKAYTFYEKKPELIVLVDHTSSIAHLEQERTVKDFVTNIKGHKKLNEHFDIAYYAFSKTIEDTLDFIFNKKQTNIAKTLGQVQQMYQNTIAPTLLISDGNQTYGTDYQFSTRTYKNPIYPVIIGDTAIVVDTKVQQLNVNTYAYLNNEFPVEVIVTYSGKKTVTTKLTITSGTKTIYSASITFSEQNNAQIINVTLPANVKGLNTYNATLEPIPFEKNKVNNTKQFAVEVIDQKTNVAIVSSITHPDIGALKKSIESNERRSVTLIKPSEFISLDPYQLVIVYNPNPEFKIIYDALRKSNKNQFTITGTHTNWKFLNEIQQRYTGDVKYQEEYYVPKYNPNFGTFLTEDIGFENYPPLLGVFGDVDMNMDHDILLYRMIGAIETKQPLLTTIEHENSREAVLFGEGIWQWRAHAYKENKSFKTFDDFLGKIVQYLSSSTVKTRLRTLVEPFYYGNANIVIRAEYFTKNYEFDRRGSLTITVTHKDQKTVEVLPMVLKNNTYAVDLSSLLPGDYEYTVKVAGEGISNSGTFSVLAYDVEQQFLNADVRRMREVAKQTKGVAFFSDQGATMINNLIADERYQTVQKSEEKTIALIDWKYLLGLLILVLSIEWFTRKYNGLI